MDLKELWIGEDVEVLSSGRVGRYEGTSKDGRARISSQGKVYLIKQSNLKIYEEPKVDKVSVMMDEMNRRSNSCKLGSTEDKIDLHIKTLNPSLVHGLPEHILNYQVTSCRSFIKQAIKSRVWAVTIIHGKGAGVLRSEVLGLLKNYNQVDRIEAIKDNGAQRIYFKY